MQPKSILTLTELTPELRQAHSCINWEDTIFYMGNFYENDKDIRDEDKTEDNLNSIINNIKKHHPSTTLKKKGISKRAWS